MVLGGSRELGELRQVLHEILTGEFAVFIEGVAYVAHFYRFQQVVDAVHAECLDGILVVGGGEDDGGFHRNLVEDGECRAVRQVDVHEDQVRQRVRLQPQHGAGDALRVAGYPDARVDFRDNIREILVSGGFVFYNQYVHGGVILTGGRHGRRSRRVLPEFVCSSIIQSVC